MKTKIKNSEVNNRMIELNSFLNQDMSGSIAYRFGRFADQLESAYKSITKLNDDYIKKHGTEKNGRYSISNDSAAIAKYNKYMDDVLDEEVEIELPKPTTLEEFEASGVQVNPKVMGYFLRIGVITEPGEEITKPTTKSTK